MLGALSKMHTAGWPAPATSSLHCALGEKAGGFWLSCVFPGRALEPQRALCERAGVTTELKLGG